MIDIYKLGWPADPFKRLTKAEMDALLRKIKTAVKDSVGEALL